MIYVYFILLGIEIAADMLGLTWLVYLTKPLLMPILMWYFYQNMTSFSKKEKNLMLMALFFSLLGDVFLMIRGANLFVFGLGSFLIAHIAYIFLFSIDAKAHLLKRLPFMAFSLIMLYFLKPVLPQAMVLPVFTYTIVITIMGIRAAERQTDFASYKWVLIGAVLFMISDSLIALNKFLMPLPLSTFWVMTTYGLAQYLIVAGYLKKNS